MERNQVALLLGKASAAYPNKAPNLKNNPQIFEEWVAALATVHWELAFENYHRHVMTNNWFPDIADIARPEPVDVNIPHEQMRLQTEELFLLMDTWENADKPPPDGYWSTVRSKIMDGGGSA